MFDPLPELSSDLDWMLQSGQAPRAMLAEALVESFYPPVYRLALAYFDDPHRARAATQATFVAALLNVYQYQNRPERSGGVQAWLFRLAFEALRREGRWSRLAPARSPSVPPVGGEEDARGVALLRIPEPARLAGALFFLLGWSLDAIAPVLALPEPRLTDYLEKFRQAAASTLEDSLLPRPGPFTAGLEGEISARLQARWPEKRLKAEEQAQFVQAVVEKAGRRGALGQRSSALKEVFWVGLAAFFVLGLVWSANTFIPEPDPTPLVPTPASRQGPTPTPFKRNQAGRGGGRASGAPNPYALIPPPREHTFELATTLADYLPRPGDTLASIAGLLNTSVESLANLNHLAPGAPIPAGTRLQVMLRPPLSDLALPTPVVPVRHRLAPLTGHSTPDEIRQYLLYSTELWHTLWGDALSIEYGPPGYVGPPRVARSQVWVSLPETSLEITGPPDGDPLYRFLTRAGLSYGYGLHFDHPYVKSSQGLLENFLFTRPFPVRDLLFPLQSDGYPDWQASPQVLGLEPVNDRTALVVDWLNAAGIRERRLWIDTLTGVVVRQQQFGGPDGLALVHEWVFRALVFDRNFPPALFDPTNLWEKRYVRDEDGRPEEAGRQPAWDFYLAQPAPGHETLVLQPPPAGLQPERSRLTFQIPFPGQPTSGLPQVDLFASGYHLGRVDFVPSLSVTCQRSPDGRTIAFANLPDWLDNKQAALPPHLLWFRLDDLNMRDPFPTGIVESFAFSPDSQDLAAVVFGWGGNWLARVSLKDGEITRLLPVQFGSSLAWSPDGEQLALIGQVESRQDELLLVDAQRGAIIRRAPYLYPDGPLPGDWPARQWGSPFPRLQMPGVEACVRPPGSST